jgi:death on curing protein
MSEPVWIDKVALLLLHARGLARFRGSEGLRDEGLLDSAMARPINLSLYGENTDKASLAASYAFGLAKNHPFVDGNKRVAFLAAGLFLELNGWRLTATQADAISAMMALAAGQIGEGEFAAWIRANIEQV